MKIGDIVCRKKYNKDIYFEIIDIKEDIYYLRGIEYRLIADSDRDDLELVNLQKTVEDVEISQEKSLWLPDGRLTASSRWPTNCA